MKDFSDRQRHRLRTASIALNALAFLSFTVITFGDYFGMPAWPTYPPGTRTLLAFDVTSMFTGEFGAHNTLLLIPFGLALVSTILSIRIIRSKSWKQLLWSEIPVAFLISSAIVLFYLVDLFVVNP